MHERFKRMVWVFKEDFTGALAKWLVKQSPYPVPDNLEKKLLTLISLFPMTLTNTGWLK